MSKTLVIAVREYLAAVKTKGFLIGLIMMPLLMGGGVVLQSLTKDIEDPTPRKIAVLDRTPGEKLLGVLQAAAEKNTVTLSDGRVRPRFIIEAAKPDTPANAVATHGDQTLIELSDRVRRGELTAFVEIEPDALQPAAKPAATQSDEPNHSIYFTTNRPALVEVREFVSRAIQPSVLAARMNESPELIQRVTQSQGRILESRGLVKRDLNGNMVFEPRSNEVATLMLPVAMVVVMLMVVLVGASPLTTNIIEEKQLRIAEVLVGSVTPFTLMLGKLLGGVATSLTLGVIYIGGAAAVASKMGMFEIVTPGLVVWFMIFTVIGSLMYGALFVVAGAAVTNVKEAQAIMTPLMLVVVLPMFMVGPLMNEPHGTIGIAGTFFPLTAPLVTMMRLTTPPPIAWWQPVGAMLSSGLLTVALVWLAGRVFRAGFLLVGRPAKFGEMIGWILRG